MAKITTHDGRCRKGQDRAARLHSQDLARVNELPGDLNEFHGQ